jgi:ribonuclease PH
VDLNLVMTESGRFVEVQGSGEESTFTRAQLDAMLEVGGAGIRQMITAQRKAVWG